MTTRSAIRDRLGAVLGSALLVSTLSGTLAPAVLADPLSPLTVTKTATPNPIASGQQLTYNIAVTNTGGAKVTYVVLTDQVNGVGVVQNPPAMPQLILSSSQGSCTQGGPNGNLVSCNIGTVNGFASFNVSIRGQVTAGNGTTLNNTASVTGTKSAQNFTTSGSVAVLVSGGTGTPLPDLTINKTGPTSIGPSAAMSYTLTVNNLGTANTSNVRVVDTLPAGVAFVSASTTSLFTCAPTVPTAPPVTVVCIGGAVNQGQNATITINATSPAATGQITNTAVVDPVNTIAESNELNNTSAAVNTNVGGPPPTPLLSIAKTDGNPDISVAWDSGAGPDPVNPGQLLVYKIQVRNNATTRADDVVMVDGTQGLEATSIVATQVVVNGAVGTTGGCVVNAPQVRCSIRSLNSGGTVTYTITGTVVSSAGATIFNTATVTGNIKNTGVTNTDSEETTVRPAIDLTITKSDSPDPICARSWPTGNANVPNHLPNPPDGLTPASGSPTALLAEPTCLGGLRYDFVIGNSGNSPATGVEVRDWLPAGLILDSYESTAGFACALESPGIVLCTGGSIGAADTETLSFLLVAPPGTGSILNTVTVDPDNHIFEPDETNNDATATTTVATGIDLVVWKGDSDGANPPGDDTFGAPTLIPGTDTNLGDGYDAIATRGTETYTIYVDNVGTQNTTGIRLRDTLPADTIFLSVVPDASHGFTCSHNGAPTGGIVECIDGRLLGTEAEFYDPAGSNPAVPGDDFATIKIRVFARATVGTMHNEVRVDPLNEIPEANELNNLDTEATTVVSGNADQGAYHQLKVTKSQTSPAPPAGDPVPPGTVATNGTLIYDLLVENLGTDPVSNITVVDTLPAGTRFIEVKDAAAGSAAFFCSHNGATYGGVITCTGGDLNGSIHRMNGTVNAAYPSYPALTDGIRRHITIKVFAPNTPATYTNQASVDPANLVPEGDEFDNDTQLDTIVAPCVGQTNCTATNAFYELTIAKSQVSPAPPTVVATNGVITYDLLIKNLGSDPVSGIAVRDTLPAGSRFIDARDTAAVLDPDAFTCGVPDATRTVTCSGGTLDGTLDTLGALVPEERTIRIRIFAPNTPTNSLVNYPNLSSVDPANGIPEGNEFNNSSNIQTPVAPCVDAAACTAGNAFYELTITKDQNRPIIARNGLETYTLTITNLGSDPVSDIVVQDALPAGARLLGARDTAPPSDPAAFTCGSPNASGVLSCTGGDLSGTVDALFGIPTSRSIQIRVFMPDTPNFPPDPDDAYTNQATVDPYNAVPEGNEFNNTTSIRTRVENGGPNPYINLTLEKTDASPSALYDGEQFVPTGDGLRYVLTVSNTGEGDAFNVTVTDALPTYMTFLNAVDSAVPAGGTPPEGAFVCSRIAEVVQCTGGTIPAGGSRTILVLGLAPANLEGIAANPADVRTFLVNRAFIDPDNAIPEGDETDNTDHVATNVAPERNLTLTKEGPTNATQNQTTEYTITVTNNTIWGDGGLAQGVRVVDGLPTGLIPIGSVQAGGNFVCQVLENPVNYVSCLGDLAAGDEVTITIPVFITADGGVLDNEACVDPDHAVAETNELDNCAHALTQVGPAVEPANLSIDKTASTGSVTAGQEFTYTVAVSNIGGTDATGTITMTDDLPSAVELMGVNPASGWSCPLPNPATPNLIECTRTGLAAGSTENIVISVKTKTGVSAPTTAFTNHAEVSGNSEVEVDEVIVGVGGSGMDLLISDITDTPDPVNRTKQLTYRIVAVNAGTADADGAVVRVQLPDAGVTVSGVTATNGFNCLVNPAILPAGMTYDCTAGVSGGFPAGSDTTITVIVTVNLGAPDELIVTATADPDNAFVESDEVNNTQTETTTVDDSVCTSSPCVDLVVSSIVDVPDGAPFGPPITYIVAVTNVGDAPVPTNVAWDIHFELTGPGVITSISVPTGVTCAPPAGTHLHCSASVGADDMDLAAGGGIVFTLTVVAGSPGNLLLTVVADSNSDAPLGSPGEVAEFSDANNFLIESTLVIP